MVDQIPTLTIDGPSGAGKGTVSRLVAHQLRWNYLDSGALYRALGVAAGWANLDLSDAASLIRCAMETHVAFTDCPDQGLRVWVNGTDATEEVRLETTGAVASAISALPEVRDVLIVRQRAFRRPPGLVADGRDMGTVIFPDATHKVFLTAAAEERAFRRHKQLMEKGVSVNLKTLLREILARDTRDARRPIAPLKAADNAILMDTTGMSIAAVVTKVLALCGVSP